MMSRQSVRAGLRLAAWLASPDAGQAILERLQRLSRPYGTSIAVEANAGVIRPR